MAWVLTVIGYFVFYIALYWVTSTLLSVILSVSLAPGVIAQEAASARPGIQKFLVGVNTITTGLAGSVFRFGFALVVITATAFFSYYFPYAGRTVAVMAGLFTYGALQSFGYGLLVALFLWAV